MQVGMTMPRTVLPSAACGSAIPRSPAQRLLSSGRRSAAPRHSSPKSTRPCCCQAAQRPLPHSEAAPDAVDVAQSSPLASYEQLKADMNRTTRNLAGFVTGYVLLTSTSDVAVCTAIGALAGYGYLQLLMRDVDSFRQDDPIAAAFLMQQDSHLELAALRSAKRVAAAYRAALRPRLLVLVGLAATAAAYSAAAPAPLNAAQVAALFGGFLTYKAGQIGQIWDATRPKFDPAALSQPPRPHFAKLDEDEEEEASEEEWRERLRGKPW